MATATTTTRAQARMGRRLALMGVEARRGNPPTVAQISAAYATMATGVFQTEQWQALLILAKQAVGVVVGCRNCGKSKTVSKYIPGKGFIRVPCPVCGGSGLRVVHAPGAGELPANEMRAVAHILNV